MMLTREACESAQVASSSRYPDTLFTMGVAGFGISSHSPGGRGMALVVKGFGRLRTKASSAGTRGPHALVYG